eukprot:TRINITY_DN3122_c0_g1_i1.p1 TRINITY_DN3122_c0_g1~~TRINITY_DN3122_c0_g1_i1.p1  ORF type:complete len:474 (-),score=71.28 TRINITY_DN3122_c0_g1_i1:246-1667(-)
MTVDSDSTRYGSEPCEAYYSVLAPLPSQLCPSTATRACPTQVTAMTQRPMLGSGGVGFTLAHAIAVAAYATFEPVLASSELALPPVCDSTHVAEMRCFLFDLDGTMYGDLSGLASTEVERMAAASPTSQVSKTPKDAWMGFIDGAMDLHHHLVQANIPFGYLSDTGCKGVEGVDAKFRSLGMPEGAGGARRVWTASLGLGEFLARNAVEFEHARVFVQESGAVYDGSTDSCLRTIRRNPRVKSDSWTIRTNMDDRQAAEWSAHAAAGKPVLIVFCAEDPVDFVDSTPDNGTRGFDFGTLKHLSWLISNGATFLAHALDDVMAFVDPVYPQLPLLVPGFGPLLKYLAQAQPDRRDSSLVIGKGGNLANEFMFKFAMKLLTQQQANHMSEAIPLQPSSCAMVGDTLNTDIVGGQDFGMKTIWFTNTGIHRLEHFPAFAAEGIRPTCRLPNASALLSLLQHNRGGVPFMEEITVFM